MPQDSATESTVTCMVRAEGLVYAYGRRRVVDGVSLHVDPGEVVGLLGRNGAGKTTTFKMIMGILRPISGKVLFREEDVTRRTLCDRAVRGMGYLAQEPSVFQRMTVRENLLAVLETRGGRAAERKSEADRMLEEFGLAARARQRAHTLSGGEMRRLEICRALLTKPSLILLDEPFSGVDPIAVGDLRNLVVGMRDRGMAILLTDHNVRDTLAVTDRSYILHEGRVLAHGAPQELVGNPEVRHAYLGEEFTL